MSSRHSTLLIICLLTSFMLLGLTKHVFADVTLDAPTVGGYALDYCLSWGANCGMPAADAYCKNEGYVGAVSFSSTPDSPPTMTMADLRVCDNSSCDRISQIVCSTGDSTFDIDGDGFPDNEDPCPDNPNPNCTDPNDFPGPELPDEIAVGDCEIDISSLKAWILSDSSFPFNFIWRIYTVISPLLDLSPAPPVLEFDFSLDPSSKYSWVPDTVPLKFDFTQFDFLAKLLRYFEIAGLCFAFAFYGMKRYRNFTGAGG